MCVLQSAEECVDGVSSQIYFPWFLSSWASHITNHNRIQRLWRHWFATWKKLHCRNIESNTIISDNQIIVSNVWILFWGFDTFKLTWPSNLSFLYFEMWWYSTLVSCWTPPYMTAFLWSEGMWLLSMYLCRRKKVNGNLVCDENKHVGRTGLWIQFHVCERSSTSRDTACWGVIEKERNGRGGM